MEETIDIPVEEVKEPVAQTPPIPAPIIKTGFLLEPELHAAIMTYLKARPLDEALPLYMPLSRLSTVQATFPGK